MSQQNAVKFAHVGEGTPHTRRATIGWTRDFDKSEITYAIAVCNESDQFNKKRGRQIVEGRIRKGGYKENGAPRSYLIPISNDAKYNDIVNTIVYRHID